MYALILANGDLNDGPAVRNALVAPTPDPVIVADGGLRHTTALGLVPSLVIGDMDSADPELLEQAARQGAQIVRFPAEKDETDLELALLAAADKHCERIRVIGAVGDRFDQTIGNAYLLALPALRACDARLVSGKQTIWLAYPGQTVIIGTPGDTLSLIPLGTASDIVTEHLQYPLQRETLTLGPARGISNVLLSDSARVTFQSGMLLLIHTIGRA